MMQMLKFRLAAVFSFLACSIVSSIVHADDMPQHAAAASAAKHYLSFGYRPGERIADLAFKDIDGKAGTLSALAGPEGVVLVVRDAECPVSQRYSPRLAELEQEYGARGIKFVYIDITPHGAKDARHDAQQYHLTGRIVLDGDRKIVGALRASSSTEVFVIDTQGTLRYRGAVDDQFGIGYSRDKPDNTWLRNALDQLLAKRTIAVEDTAAPGCLLDFDMDAAGKARPVTYNNRISRIIQRKCESCHRVGGVAPMPLQNYKQVADRAAIIDYMTSNRIMPPWSADRHVGTWAKDASLSERDLADLHAWLKGGAPEGRKSDAPIARTFTPGWNMEHPDAILQIPEQFEVPASGVVSYKYTYLKTDFDSDKWVSQIEIHPTAPRVVHHVLFFVEEPGRKFFFDPARKPGEPLANDGGGGFFGGSAPGYPMMTFPEGTAKKLPKGAWLKFQIHYQPNGVDQIDQTQVALKFVDEPAVSSGTLKEVQTTALLTTNFAIPPGASNYEISAQYAFTDAGTLISLMPHAHLRGKAWKIWLEAKDGTKTLLLDVPKFNFAWQTYYTFKEPVHVEPGMKLLATAWYDNSSENPYNPDATKTVRFGEQTFEEMMLCYFDWIADPK